MQKLTNSGTNRFVIDRIRSRIETQTYSMSPSNIGASVQHNVQNGMCVQRKLKSVSVSAQSEQSISFPPEETLEPWLSIEHPLKTQISLRMGAG